MKLTKQVNYRVVIGVERHPWLNTSGQKREEELMHDTCKEICDAIERVCYAINKSSAKPRVESTTVCAFCSYEWANAVDEAGKPACCNKALSEWESQQPKSQQFGAGA